MCNKKSSPKVGEPYFIFWFEIKVDDFNNSLH